MKNNKNQWQAVQSHFAKINTNNARTQRAKLIAELEKTLNQLNNRRVK